MTEIIINDVDISECKFFVKERLEDFDVYIKNACGINGTECCLVPECYYKQLKRLETENAELKEKLERIERILIRCTKSILVKGTNAGCKECEWTGICEEYLLKIIRGEK